MIVENILPAIAELTKMK